MVGNDLGGRPEGVLPEKNAKIPEVVKVNNYHFLIYFYIFYISLIYDPVKKIEYSHTKSIFLCTFFGHKTANFCYNFQKSCYLV
jgi:hypothetical protein